MELSAGGVLLEGRVSPDIIDANAEGLSLPSAFSDINGSVLPGVPLFHLSAASP